MTEEKRRKLLSLFWEFFRYAVVGGIAFLADYGTLFLFQELILTGGTPWELFISTAAGFIVGLIVNYVLSLTFVFRRKDNRGSGKSVAAFLIFTVVGVIGLGLTELSNVPRDRAAAYKLPYCKDSRRRHRPCMELRRTKGTDI